MELPKCQLHHVHGSSCFDWSSSFIQQDSSKLCLPKWLLETTPHDRSLLVLFILLIGSYKSPMSKDIPITFNKYLG